MGCLVVLLSMVSARLALLFVWIFTTLVDRAFDNFFVPLVGLLFLPWTTLVYVLVYAPVRGVNPFGWFLVALAVIADVSSWGRSRVEQRARYT
jgi:hypothetical protein